MPRTETIEKTVFTFAELSDDAKERARDWWRECVTQDFHYCSGWVIEDAEQVAAILGIEFDTRPVKLMNGDTRRKSIVYWSGFARRGDGACFEGRYSYAKGCAKAIRAHAPTDTRLHAIADSLLEAQKRAFYKLEASATHRGPYCHSGCMEVNVSHADSSWRDVGPAGETIERAMRDFADWIYRQLEAAYDDAMSDESIDELIEANEYEFEFDEHGRIH